MNKPRSTHGPHTVAAPIPSSHKRERARRIDRAFAVRSSLAAELCSGHKDRSLAYTHTHTRANTGGGSFCVRRAWAPSRATPARHGRCYSVRCAGAIQCFQGPNDSPCVALQLYPAPPAGTRAINITGVRAVSVRWWWRWWWQRRTPGFYSIRTGRQTTRCRVLGIHNTKEGTGCVMKM